MSSLPLYMQMVVDKGELQKESSMLCSQLVAEKQHAAVLQVISSDHFQLVRYLCYCCYAHCRHCCHKARVSLFWQIGAVAVK